MSRSLYLPSIKVLVPTRWMWTGISVSWWCRCSMVLLMIDATVRLFGDVGYA